MRKTQFIDDSTLKKLIEDESATAKLAKKADRIRRKFYSNKVYLRGLIEISNICKNDCYYCGIRRSNKNVRRYRLNKEDILEAAEFGYRLGFRTFVLQGGEDSYFDKDRMTEIIKEIKASFADCALTLSLGERPYEDYEAFYKAGADRYLLREETSNKDHYEKIHPKEMDFERRRASLRALSDIGFQAGGGFMVDSPYQKTEDLIADIRFLEEIKPAMIGIGPFLVSHDTPFKNFPDGSFTKTLRLISILRIIFPYALIPATTALGTISPEGRKLGLKAGANVLMPNLSPPRAKESYNLYDNKLNTGLEAASSKKALEEEIKSFGYEAVDSRGDVCDI